MGAGGGGGNSNSSNSGGASNIHMGSMGNHSHHNIHGHTLNLTHNHHLPRPNSTGQLTPTPGNWHPILL